MLVLHKSGEVKARCEECRKLYVLSEAERASLEKYGDAYAPLCLPCYAEVIAYSKAIGAIPPRKKRVKA